MTQVSDADILKALAKEMKGMMSDAEARKDVAAMIWRAREFYISDLLLLTIPNTHLNNNDTESCEIAKELNPKIAREETDASNRRVNYLVRFAVWYIFSFIF